MVRVATADTLALSALERFGIRPRSITPLARDVRRVDAHDGQRYALRCRPVADRVFGDIPLELAWMAALRAETEIEPPEPVPGIDGNPLQEVEDHDCILFRWMPGVELEHRLTAANLRKLGILSARLHQHAATFQPPPDLPVRNLDRLVRGAERLVLFEPEHAALVPPARAAVFREISNRYTAIVTALFADPGSRRVIHSDLHHENVKVYRGKLRPLDFYEVIWGYPLQDVALTLYDLKYFARCSPALTAGFRAGYETRLPWPEQHPGDIDTLIAARLLRRANWVLEHEAGRVDHAKLEPFLKWTEDELRAQLDGAA